MSEKNKIIAADLGSSHIALMAAEVVRGAVRVVGGTVKAGRNSVENLESAVQVLAVEENHKNGYVSNGVVVQPSGVAFQIGELSKKLNNFLRLKKGKEITGIYVSVNAKSMKCVRHTVSNTFERFTEITTDHLSKMEEKCRTELTQGDTVVYDILAIDFKLDNKNFDEPPVKLKGYDLQITYNVVVGDKIIEENIIKSFNRFDISERTISPKKYKPLSVESLAESVLTPEDTEDGVALLNIGATTTTLALYTNGILETLLVVPLGGYNITKDIEAEGMSESDAENLKINLGAAMKSIILKPVNIVVDSVLPDMVEVKIETPYLAEIIEARLKEIFKPIFDVLKIERNKIGAGIVLTGGGSNLKGIGEFIQKNTDMYVRFGDHSDKLTENTDKRFAEPVYAQLVGMCLLIDEHKRNNPDPDEPPVIPSFKERIEHYLGTLFPDPPNAKKPIY